MFSSNYRLRSLLPLLAVVGQVDAAFVPEAEKQVITLPLSKSAPVVDGKLAAGEYADAVILGGSFRGWGVSPRPQSPTVYLKRTADRFHVLVDNPLKEGERPSMRGAVPDNPGIAMGNAIELFFLPHQPDGELLAYIQFIGNARGCIYDALSRPQVGVTYVAEFNLPWQYANTIVPGHWHSEISTTFADLNVASTADGEWFDFDIGRDGGTGPNGVHSYTMAYHQIQNGKGVRIVFDADAPATQWLSFGDFEHARFNPHLRLVGNGRESTLTVQVAVHAPDKAADGGLPLLWESSRELTVPADGMAEVAFSHDLAVESRGVARYRIVDADGTVRFYRELPYQTNASPPPLYAQAEAKPLVATAEMAPSYGRIGVSADIIDFPGDKEKVAVDVVAKRQGTALARLRLERFQLDFATGILAVGELTEGAYDIEFQLVDRADGQPLGPRETVALERTFHDWENNDLGLGDRVPAPWTPLEVSGFGFQISGQLEPPGPGGNAAVPNASQTPVISVWGRQYSFTGMALPASIPTRQPNPARGPEIADVLAGPVRIVSEVDGRAETWQAGELVPGAVQKSSAALSGSGTSPTLAARVEGTLDFDGFYKMRLRIQPTVADTEYSSIRIEVPVPTETARLFHCVGESMRENKTFADFADLGDGRLWDSKSAARNALVQGNFLPVAWLGSEDRGIAWMCDTDRTWQIAFDQPCLDVVRHGDQTVFRMHLLNRPGRLAAPIEVVFSLQATPVRPRPVGGTWKDVDWYGWGHFDMPLIYHGCFDAYRKGELPENGPWYRTPEAREQNRWWRYGCFNSDRIRKTDPTYGAIVRDFGAEWYSESVWVKYQNRAHQDFELWAWKQWHDEASLDGLYFDNTFPAPSTNLLNDTAYIDEYGRLRPGYVVMAYREFMKRLRVMLLDCGPSPVLKAHITDTPIPGFLGLCDFWLDGENGGYPDPQMQNPDFVDRWYNPTGMANLRITLGQQWGTIPLYFYNWGIESTHAVLGLFDLPNWYQPMGQRPYHDFGLNQADVRYIPFWTSKPPATVAGGGPAVLLTVWTRPGQARILVSNLSDEDRDVILDLDPQRLGVAAAAVALDEREGGLLPKSGNQLGPIRVYRHDYQALIIAEPGRYQPLPPEFGDKLMPAVALRISQLCDDFSSLNPAWEAHLSPDIDRATHGHGVPSEPVASRWNRLRLRTGDGLFANLRRPFGQDACTVQVRFRAPGTANPYTQSWRQRPTQFAGGLGPALGLRWADGREIRLRTGEPTLQGRFAGEGRAADGRRVFAHIGGPEMGFINFLRLELHPDRLVFRASGDGVQWQDVHTVSRDGFEGAPDELLLGHGLDTDVHKAAHTVDVYYDDLVVAKLQGE